MREQGGEGSLQIVAVAVLSALCELLLGTVVLRCAFSVLGVGHCGVGRGGADGKAVAAAVKLGKAS